MTFYKSDRKEGWSQGIVKNHTVVVTDPQIGELLQMQFFTKE